MHSYETDDAMAVWEAVSGWWEKLSKEEALEFAPAGGDVGFGGGCLMLAPVRVGQQHTTLWLMSTGEDAFDSIVHYANVVQEIAETADSEIEITWTELPHREGPKD